MIGVGDLFRCEEDLTQLRCRHMHEDEEIRYMLSGGETSILVVGIISLHNIQ